MQNTAWAIIVVCLAAGATSWVCHARAPSRASSHVGGLSKLDVLARETTTDAIVRPGRSPGTVQFDLGGLGNCTGVAGAWYIPSDARHRRPKIHHATELSLLQFRNGELRLGKWLEASRMVGSGYLFFSLRIGAENEAKFLLGAAAVDRWMLESEGIVVSPPHRAPRLLGVRTLDGTPVPGAHIVVNRGSFPVGPGSLSIATGPAGQATIYGLHPRVPWTATHLGFGPVGRTTSELADDITAIRIPMHGAWTFVPIVVSRFGRGHSIEFTGMATGKGTSDRVSLVSAMVLPGSTQHTTVYAVVAPGASVEPRSWTMFARGLKPAAVHVDTDGVRRVRYDFSSMLAKPVVARAKARATASR